MERTNRFEREREKKCDAWLRNNQRRQETDDEVFKTRSAKTISDDEHRMLQKFREKMDNIQYNTCNVCNKRIY